MTAAAAPLHGDRNLGITAVMLCWIYSAHGVAIGTWGADLVGAVAIVVALIANQRAKDNALAEVTRNEKLRHKQFTDFAQTSAALLGRGACLIRSVQNDFATRPGVQYLSMDGTLPKLLKELRPIEDAVSALRAATPFDADMVLALSRARQSMVQLFEQEPLTYNWNFSYANTRLSDVLESLEDARRGILHRATVGSERTIRPR